MPQHDKLRLALSRNRQRLVSNNLKTSLRPILGKNVTFTEITESMRISAMILNGLSERRPAEDGELLITQDAEVLGAAVRRYFDQRKPDMFYVFLSHYEEAGGVVLQAAILADHALRLLHLDGDTIYGCTEHSEQVFSLDVTEKPTSRTYQLFTFADNSIQNR